MGSDNIGGENEEENREERPFKRLKLCSPRQQQRHSSAQQSRHRRQQFSSWSSSSSSLPKQLGMAKGLPAAAQEDEALGSKGLIRRVELVRIITQALYSLGYDRAAALLEEESGIPLQLPIVSSFRRDILDGRWDESVVTLGKIGALDSYSYKAAAFLILQQKFLEQLVCRGDIHGALKTLRSEISPLQIQTQRVHELAGCVVCPTKEELLERVGWKGSGYEAKTALLLKLQELLPPHLMIPEKRLESLLEQVLTVQRNACIFHNSSDNSMSLYTDHKCGRDQIPTETLQVLEAHDNEVWYLQFSRDGRHLASASRDCTAIIWEVVNNDYVKMKHKLTGHSKPVSFVAWSPDGSMLLTCGTEEAVKLWDWKTPECKHTYEKQGASFSSCAWFPDGKSFVAGGSDKAIYRWDLKGNELEVWKWPKMPRINDLAITPDGKHLICITCDNVLRIFNIDDKSDDDMPEDGAITSLSVSVDGKYLLVNLVSQEIHLWDLTSKTRLPCKFKGHRQGRFVIRSCFGGSGNCFIVSGSEDSQVYIWHRGNAELLEVLPGHAGTVNCVSWNPKNPHMFASASDDHTIRIWGVKRSSSGAGGSSSSSASLTTSNVATDSNGNLNKNASTSNGDISHIINGGTRELLENLRPF